MEIRIERRGNIRKRGPYRLYALQARKNLRK
jgi:hypothetical protein